MLKRNITFEDYDGNKVTETHYFNLTATELINLEVGYEGGLAAALERIIDEKDGKKLIVEFQRIVLAAYGVKSEDGKRFIKNEQLREEFKQTAAYDALFMELAMDADVAAVFINGIIPRDISKFAAKTAVDTPAIPTPAQTPPVAWQPPATDE